MMNDMNMTPRGRGHRGGRRYHRDPNGFGHEERGGFDRGHRGGPHGGHHGGGRPGGPRGRGRGRGDTRAAILLLLAEQPRHGYELIQEISERSEGAWNPSPGSVYPALQVLQDEGLVTVEAVDGRRVASLTEAGREHVETHRDRIGTPWDAAGLTGGPVAGLRHEARAVVDAAVQVGRVGTAAQAEAAVALLRETRRALYRLLADDGADQAPTS